MNKGTIIVVDAWKHCEKEDVIQFPHIEQEARLFGRFLNLRLKNLRSSYTIVHCADGRETMDEINTSEDIVINKIHETPDTGGPYYFCGFHLGRCIDRKYNELGRTSHIIVNLSLLYPEDGYYKIDNTKNMCYSTYRGMEKCNMI
jgi:hypothetical protein